MRVTHVITRLIVGGAQENTAASVLGFQQKPGFDVTLISGPTSGAEGSLLPLFKDQPRALTLVPQLVRPVHPWKDWITLRRLTEIFRQTRPDIVHTHSGKAGVLGRIAAAKARVPVIIHTIHGPSFGPFQGPIANSLFRAAERRAGRKTTHFVAVADALTQQYLHAGIGRPEQYTRIRSGFDLKPFLSASNDPGERARWGIAPSDIVVGKIARLFKLKGQEDLLSVAPALLRECPQFRFLLVGDGDRRRELEAQALSLGLGDRVIFTGLVAPAEMPPLVGIMDIVAHLSRREGLARALSQSLAASRPIVAYDCDGAREVCLDDQTGYLVAPGDLKALTRRLLQLGRDRPLRDRLGTQGRILVKAEFGLDQMIQRLHELYVELARRHQIPIV